MVPEQREPPAWDSGEAVGSPGASPGGDEPSAPRASSYPDGIALQRQKPSPTQVLTDQHPTPEYC